MLLLTSGHPTSGHPTSGLTRSLAGRLVRRLIFALMLAMFLAISLTGATGRAMAADFDKAKAAYEAGDYATAAQEFRPLAEAGDAKSQFDLGFLYSNGKGVPQDYITAHMWANLAASNSNDLSTGLRAIIASEMSPAEIERAQARAAQCLASNYQDCGG